MEEDKYYTPVIEEFHVGFEYKYYEQCLFYLPDKKTPIWINKVFGNEYEELDSVAYDIEQTPSNIKVKYLDKEDIEDLNFVHKGAMWFQNADGMYRIRWWRDHEIDIWKGLHDLENMIIFRGTIKNKSEFKVLLKQLGI